MALGGVATGNIKAQDAPKPMMSESPNGLSSIFSATEIKIGTNSAAVTLKVGKSQVVKVLNGAGPFVAIAKDPNVVETSVKGNEVTLTGRKVSATTVEVKDKDNNLGIISITVK